MNLSKVLPATLAALIAATCVSYGAFVFSTDRIIGTGAAAPVATACGTGPVVSGTDLAGTVTPGTGATGCVVTFNVPKAGAPYCVVVNQTAPATSTPAYTVTATAITTVQGTGQFIFNYFCVDRAGG